MKKSFEPAYYSLAYLGIIALFSTSCKKDQDLEKRDFEVRTWGGWSLLGTISLSSPDSVVTSNTEQYLERNYQGWQVAGPASTSEIDSVYLYENKKIILASKVDEKVAFELDNQKITYRLSNGQYYWVKLIPLEEDGHSKDQLLVSDFKNSREDLAKSQVYKYIRSKRPW